MDSEPKPALRASNADREVVARRLHDALAEGRITIAELEERLDILYRTTTVEELGALTRDLPSSDLRTAAPPGQTVVSADRSPARIRTLAIMGSGGHNAPATIGPRQQIIAVMGGVSWDLTGSTFSAAHCTIMVNALMGGAEFVVADDVSIEMDGFALMGGFDGPRDAHVPNARVTLRFTGAVMMGGVTVRRATRRKKFLR